MSLTIAGIHCTISQRLSGATEDCSTVRVQQPRTLCHQRCCMSASRRMFGSLWIAAAAHERRRQDCSRRPGRMAKRQTTTGERKWPPWSGRAGALVVVASVADGALTMVGASSTGHQTGSGVLNRLQPVHQSLQDAEEQRVVCTNFDLGLTWIDPLLTKICAKNDFYISNHPLWLWFVL